MPDLIYVDNRSILRYTFGRRVSQSKYSKRATVGKLTVVLLTVWPKDGLTPGSQMRVLDGFAVAIPREFQAIVLTGDLEL